MWDRKWYSVFGGLILLAAVALTGPSSAQAETGSPVVVELFTAHDCPFCPPANAYLKKLAERDDVIALSFMVDYWDHPDFKDLPNHEQRQRTYGWMKGKDTVFTPEMVIGGEEHAAGYRRFLVSGKIRAEKKVAQDNHLVIGASQTPERITFSLPASTRFNETHDIVLIPYKAEVTVSVSPGPVDDRTYTNFAFVPRTLGHWSGDERNITVGISSDTADSITGFVLILQEQGQGKIHAAKMIAIEGRS